MERLFEAVLGMTDVYMVYLGDRLGLYSALAAGRATEAEIAEASGTDRRYLREWLEQQAVTSLIEVDDPSKPAEQRRYRLPTATPRCSSTATALRTCRRSPA